MLIGHFETTGHEVILVIQLSEHYKNQLDLKLPTMTFARAWNFANYLQHVGLFFDQYDLFSKCQGNRLQCSFQFWVVYL